MFLNASQPRQVSKLSLPISKSYDCLFIKSNRTFLFCTDTESVKRYSVLTRVLRSIDLPIRVW